MVGGVTMINPRRIVISTVIVSWLISISHELPPTHFPISNYNEGINYCQPPNTSPQWLGILNILTGVIDKWIRR